MKPLCVILVVLLSLPAYAKTFYMRDGDCVAGKTIVCMSKLEAKILAAANETKQQQIEALIKKQHAERKSFLVRLALMAEVDDAPDTVEIDCDPIETEGSSLSTGGWLVIVVVSSALAFGSGLLVAKPWAK